MLFNYSINELRLSLNPTCILWLMEHHHQLLKAFFGDFVMQKLVGRTKKEIQRAYPN